MTQKVDANVTRGKGADDRFLSRREEEGDRPVGRACDGVYGYPVYDVFIHNFFFFLPRHILASPH